MDIKELEQQLEEANEECDWWREQVRECHDHLTRFGIGKGHWSLLGRLALLQAEPKGNVFESRVVRLLLTIRGLTDLCDKANLAGIELDAARGILRESADWDPSLEEKGNE
jgi:hypothetical protein